MGHGLGPYVCVSRSQAPEMRARPAAPASTEVAKGWECVQWERPPRGCCPACRWWGLNVSEWEMLWEFKKEVKCTNISWWCYYYYYYVWRPLLLEGKRQLCTEPAPCVCASREGPDRGLASP